MLKRFNSITRKFLLTLIAVAFTIIPLTTKSAQAAMSKDPTAPLGHVLVNSWWNATISLNVTLKLATADNVSDAANVQIMVSNNADYSGATWESFKQTKSWTLNGPEGTPATKRVYIRFKDQAGNITSQFVDANYSPLGFGCGGASEILSVHRFWSDSYKSHFFTISETEKNNIIATNPNWKYEGTGFKVWGENCSGVEPVFRFWSDSSKSHFFTKDRMEWLFIQARYPEATWKYEFISYWTVHQEDDGATPLYRFWSDAYQGHFYTKDEWEKDAIIANNHNWIYEGVAYYVK